MRLCELTLSFITALAPIDLLGYFKSGLDFNPAFPQVSSGVRSVVVIRHIHAQQWWENAHETQLREEKSIYIKNIGHFLNNKRVAHSLIIYK